jgi:hypothetical protein
MVPDSTDILIVRIPACRNNAAKSRDLVLLPVVCFHALYSSFQFEVLA